MRTLYLIQAISELPKIYECLQDRPYVLLSYKEAAPKTAARKANNFFGNKMNDTRDVQAAPTGIVYSGQLADWLRQRKYMVMSNSAAYFASTGRFAAINQHAQNQRKEFEAKI